MTVKRLESMVVKSKLGFNGKGLRGSGSEVRKNKIAVKIIFFNNKIEKKIRSELRLNLQVKPWKLFCKHLSEQKYCE